MAARPPARLPPSLRGPALTRSTEPRTTSDTLCRSSAAVPGLLNARVNFRVSAEEGSSGGCDILATSAAAEPAPAVRPGRAAARCALGARPGPPSAPGAAACSPRRSPRVRAAQPEPRPPLGVTPRATPLGSRGPPRSERRRGSLGATVLVAATAAPPCHQPPSAPARRAASSGRGVRRGAGRGGRRRGQRGRTAGPAGRAAGALRRGRRAAGGWQRAAPDAWRGR